MTIIYDNGITWEEFCKLLEKRLEEERSKPREIDFNWYLMTEEDIIEDLKIDTHEIRTNFPNNR
jgi:hypothetical protein